jgi:hypothetical protein
MEKIMSKTNDTSKAAALEDHHPLADSELDAVTGGIFREPTYHPAKVTVPDIKLGISFAETPATDRHSPV